MYARKESRALSPGWTAFMVLASILVSACATTKNNSRSLGTHAGANAQVRECTGLSRSDRHEILRLSDPNNFPRARYKKRWNDTRPIEQETDCSKFVHEIYRRAGLPFPRATTKALRNLREFREVSASTAKPGDLVVFPTHVGILANDGQVISATLGGPRRKLATRSRKDPRFRSTIAKLPKEQFSERYVFLQYACKPGEED